MVEMIAQRTSAPHSRFPPRADEPKCDERLAKTRAQKPVLLLTRAERREAERTAPQFVIETQSAERQAHGIC